MTDSDQGEHDLGDRDLTARSSVRSIPKALELKEVSRISRDSGCYADSPASAGHGRQSAMSPHARFMFGTPPETSLASYAEAATDGGDTSYNDQYASDVFISAPYTEQRSHIDDDGDEEEDDDEVFSLSCERDGQIQDSGVHDTSDTYPLPPAVAASSPINVPSAPTHGNSGIEISSSYPLSIGDVNEIRLRQRRGRHRQVAGSVADAITQSMDGAAGPLPDVVQQSMRSRTYSESAIYSRQLTESVGTSLRNISDQFSEIHFHRRNNLKLLQKLQEGKSLVDSSQTQMSTETQVHNAQGRRRNSILSSLHQKIFRH